MLSYAFLDALRAAPPTSEEQVDLGLLLLDPAVWGPPPAPVTKRGTPATPIAVDRRKHLSARRAQARRRRLAHAARRRGVRNGTAGATGSID